MFARGWLWPLPDSLKPLSKPRSAWNPVSIHHRTVEYLAKVSPEDPTNAGVRMGPPTGFLGALVRMQRETLDAFPCARSLRHPPESRGVHDACHPRLLA